MSSAEQDKTHPVDDAPLKMVSGLADFARSP